MLLVWMADRNHPKLPINLETFKLETFQPLEHFKSSNGFSDERYSGEHQSIKHQSGRSIGNQVVKG